MNDKEKLTQPELEERVAELEKRMAVHKKKAQSYRKWLDDQACERRLDFYSRKDIWLESETYENAGRGFNALFSPDYDPDNKYNFEDHAKHMKKAIGKYYKDRIDKFRAENPEQNPYALADGRSYGTITYIKDE